MKKTFVLDTNVLLHNSESIESFADNNVVLPMPVIEELDRFKSRNDELGRNARMVIRSLDDLRQKGSLKDGVTMDNGGILKIVMYGTPESKTGLDQKIPDNMILQIAFNLHKKGEQVIFVSKDINARLKADSLGILTNDFEKQKINFDELFSGFREVTLPKSSIDDFYNNPSFEVPGLDTFPNEFILLKDESNEKHSAMGRARGNNTLAHLNPNFETAWSVKPKNREQRIALELLLDSSLSIVTLVGQAGTGKTLLALAAALETTRRHNKYDKILVSRPIIPLGKDIGYLPGDKEEKLLNWMQPIFDNLTYLMTGGKQKKEEKETQSARSKVDRLFKSGAIELEALTYMRGRSIPNHFIIVDEAQNLTPHEIKTIISRAGEGTKMVLTGDPYQIDNPYLDSSSNGLSYAVDILKHHAIHGHITLRNSERSELAALAAAYL